MKLDQDEYLQLFLNKPHFTTWQLIKVFWQSSQRSKAYAFLIITLIMTISMVGFDVVFTYWFNFFYNALQAYDKREALKLLLFFCVLATLNIIVAVYRFYIVQLFGLRWRRWLTHQFVGRWLHNKGYYYLENFDQKTDNPDQRIQEDVFALVTNTLDLFFGLVSAITTFFAFIYVLWTLSGTLIIPLGSLGTLKIPGYLLWVGLIYAFIGTFFTFKIGKPLVGLNFEQQRREASFRFAAIDLRSHSENVAMYDGEDHQQSVLNKLFRGVLDNYYLIILRQKLLLWFTAGYGQTSVLLPLVVALPNYFGKVFLLGGLMQSLQAFRSVQDSLSFIVNSYTQIAQWQAVSRRLTTFANHINDVEERAKEANHLSFTKHSPKNIAARNLTISTPNKDTLLQRIDETFEHGQNYLIKGRSGIGKSTFVKTLAGIWPFASGNITLPENQKVMFLPQKPYMPLGSLEEAILFPDKQRKEDEEKVKQILLACHLDHLIPRLKEVAAWSEQLSPGELQRIAFARVLLHKPDWVFLDETTSMLDLANEKSLYELLKAQLPDCSIVSVGHRPSLDIYHDHLIEMSKYEVNLSQA